MGNSNEDMIDDINTKLFYIKRRNLIIFNTKCIWTQITEKNKSYILRINLENPKYEIYKPKITKGINTQRVQIYIDKVFIPKKYLMKITEISNDFLEKLFKVIPDNRISNKFNPETKITVDEINKLDNIYEVYPIVNFNDYPIDEQVFIVQWNIRIII